MGTKFEAKTIELGGVATGNMKAQLATIVRGKVSNKGFTSRLKPTLAITGMKVIVVVRLLVNSVRNKTNNMIKATTIIEGPEDVLISKSNTNSLEGKLI